MNLKIKIEKLLKELPLNLIIRHKINKNKDFKNKIIKETSFLNSNCKTSERLYCILNDIKNPITCIKCNNLVKYILKKEYCSALWKLKGLNINTYKPLLKDF